MRIKPIKDGKQEQVEQARNFANKIWNASRFVLISLGEGFVPRAEIPAPQTLTDRWILSRLSVTAETVNAAFDSYNLDDAARALYEFFWDDFCDWYVEAAKPRLQAEASADAVRQLLYHVLEQTLRLLHPIMPYLTEAIWQTLRSPSSANVATLPGAKTLTGKAFLMFAPFPTASVAPRDETAEGDLAILQETIRAIRNLRSENNVKGAGGEAFVSPGDDEVRALLADADNAALVRFLARVETVTIGDGDANGYLAATKYGTVRIPRPEATPEELAQERLRLEKELAKIEKDRPGLSARLENPDFLARSPAPVIEKAQAQAADLDERKAKLSERLAQLAA
ncbi:MAG: class I tRNA ligase family protein [Armatimonadetes bacterium]|nr:class I tRNA ligase family protein [Armatimonadota bacterium]